ncbi:hypothetical protein NPIL_153821 [Nephila pilipes]|uniref:Uncharacterized protein n=1 Tax=Nephila pilipes TaxID=299642 RepID=A0A8X6Q7K6_NEPPI|nr:hypothetical protein NPIL_153821 [Nephila pilipes]
MTTEMEIAKQKRKAARATYSKTVNKLQEILAAESPDEDDLEIHLECDFATPIAPLDVLNPTVPYCVDRCSHFTQPLCCSPAVLPCGILLNSTICSY